LAAARDRSQADWYSGNCSFRLAGELRGRPERVGTDLQQALRHVERTIEVGEPVSLLGQAWFEKAEILSALGECEMALQAFTRVPDFEGSSTATLAVRARRRHDEVQIGKGLVGIRGRGCG
jgi:hypothetical protein